MSLGVVVGASNACSMLVTTVCRLRPALDHHGLERGHVDVHQPASFGNSTRTTAFATSS